MSEAKEYAGKDVIVTFDAAVCEHAAKCVRGLPNVFDTEKRPWIDPDGAPADAVRAQVGRCPSGALQWHDPVSTDSGFIDPESSS